ncbi:MAG TPA: hypothetical protein VGR07_21065 [Thermoanaerobaculia bacterium]|jgi:hypothetical protein|nr:hypothetical protein [Thermoanaerobaculia bacterium]
MKYNHSLALLLTLALPLAAGCRARSVHEATDSSLGTPYSASAAHLDPVKARNMVSDVTLGKKVSADGNILSADQANKFAPGEPIYIEMKVGGAPAGTAVKVDWYDAADKKVAEDQKTVGKKVKYVDFQAKDAASWPQGDYRAEVWVGDQKVATQQFTIAERSS